MPGTSWHSLGQIPPAAPPAAPPPAPPTAVGTRKGSLVQSSCSASRSPAQCCLPASCRHGPSPHVVPMSTRAADLAQLVRQFALLTLLWRVDLLHGPQRTSAQPTLKETETARRTAHVCTGYLAQRTGYPAYCMLLSRNVHVSTNQRQVLRNVAATRARASSSPPRKKENKETTNQRYV